MRRQATWTDLASQHFDLLIIGGGITGAGIAREATNRGLRVGLVERGDFAAGTSSRSSKLIHGGLRYLKLPDFSLVHESVIERQNLIDMAPHLARPMPFLFPVRKGDPDPMIILRLGLLLYDRFAGPRRLFRHKVRSKQDTLKLEPHLSEEGLKSSALYYDCVTDDARLTLAVLASARAGGATLLNYAEVVGFCHSEEGRVLGADVIDLESGARACVKATKIINATGPWLDLVRRLDHAGSQPLLRLTKGIHVTFKREKMPLKQAVVIRGPDKRMMFAVPAGNCTYVGTTDTDYSGDPAAVAVDTEDVDYVLQAANGAFRTKVGLEDVHSTWAGLRALVAPSVDAAPSDVSREYMLETSQTGLVSIAGGKLTAFRAMAEKIVDAVFPDLLPAPERSLSPLPGAGLVETPQLARWAHDLGWPVSEVEQLALRYGSLYEEVLTGCKSAGDADPHSTRLHAELRYALANEWVCHLDDFLVRRTSEILFGPQNGLDVAEPLALDMAEEFGWDTKRVNEEVTQYRRQVAAMFPWRHPRGRLTLRT